MRADQGGRIGRNILSLSAIAALGLGLLPGHAIAQQSEADKVKAVLDAFHAALSSLDLGKMDAVWAHDADAMLVNPRDKSISVGWDAIKKNWEANFNSWSELKVTRASGSIRVSGNVAWATGLLCHRHESRRALFGNIARRPRSTFLERLTPTPRPSNRSASTIAANVNTGLRWNWWHHSSRSTERRLFGLAGSNEP